MQDLFELDYLLPLWITLVVAVIVFYVLFAVAEWKILKKAGEKGWKSLIPVYNVFVSHHIVGMSHIWFILEVASWIIELALELIPAIPEPVGLVFGIATGAFTLISEAVHMVKMCCCFGKGTGFKIGAVLIPDLFLMIIAFGKAQYTKPQH